MTDQTAPRAPRSERAERMALFRYSLIREPADPALPPRRRGALVRALAAREHTGPDGRPVRISRVTLDRWIRAYVVGGYAALLPAPRHVVPRTPADVLDLAAAIKAEEPERTAAQVAEVLRAGYGSAPSPRTLQRHFRRAGLATRGAERELGYGRFEAGRVNELWVGDHLHGPAVAGRKSYLFALLDDHSRAVVGYRWAGAEDTVRMEAALRAALAARGVPDMLYLDNGAAFVGAQLLRTCAVLGIRLAHSRPGRPQGRGKIERFFRTVREQFLVELSHHVGGHGGPGACDLSELNRLFAAWVETVYHARVHSETGAAPLARLAAADPPRLPSPAELHEAFLWCAHRTVTKTATVTLHGNSYGVDAALVGRRVELQFDPFDLSRVHVSYQGRAMGDAVPAEIRRHAHPQARPEPAESSLPPTGIDYLALVEAAHATELARRIDYAALSGAGPDDGPDDDPDADDDTAAGPASTEEPS
jgi:putative transposase